MKLNKINFKQPKYILPLVTVLPVLFLVHTIANFTGNGDTANKGVVTDSINMSLPDAREGGIADKMSALNDRLSEDGAYTAIDGIGDDEQQKDSTRSGYSEAEMDDIDKTNAERQRQQKAMEDMQRSLAESRKHINSYAGGGSGGGSYGRGHSQSDDYDDYAKEIEAIQRRSAARQKAYNDALGMNSDEGYGSSGSPSSANGSSSKNARNSKNGKGSKGGSTDATPETALVYKVQDQNAGKFNTIGTESSVDEPLIKAMIDKTTKAHEGTRLRFKLLDDVTIKGTKLKKGTYLYGIVTGFGQQRVKAEITSILVKNKFIRVSLSVYDNDGMEGFYVPESAFRDMMKEAGTQAMQNNITFDTGGGYELSGEAVALQALHNMYSSASNAVAGNMRKNKARIKYNTIVYLINQASPDPSDRRGD